MENQKRLTSKEWLKQNSALFESFIGKNVNVSVIDKKIPEPIKFSTNLITVVPGKITGMINKPEKFLFDGKMVSPICVSIKFDAGIFHIVIDKYTFLITISEGKRALKIDGKAHTIIITER